MSIEVRLRCLELASRFAKDPAEAMSLAEAFEQFGAGRSATFMTRLIEAAGLETDMQSFGLFAESSLGTSAHAGGVPSSSPSVPLAGEAYASGVGLRLTAFRRHLGLLQHEAAAKFDVGLRTWSRYENSDRFPKRRVLEALSRAGLNLQWLLFGAQGGSMLLPAEPAATSADCR